MVTRPAADPDRNDDLLAVARALSDPTRLRLFLALRQAERCVTDLVSTVGVSQPLASHHLRVLSLAGLVQTRRADGFKMYAVSPDGMATAMAVLEGVLDPERVSPMARPGGNEACCRS